MDGARDLAGGFLRTALRFQGTRLAIQLAGAIAHHAVLIDKRARHSIDFLALPEFLPGRADIAVALVVIGKSSREKVPSVCWDLSNTGMCGSIPCSLTSQFSISAVP